MAKDKCIVFDCEFMNNARGMCKTHYGQWLRENKGVVLNAPHMVVAEMSDEEKEQYWQWVKKELRLV